MLQATCSERLLLYSQALHLGARVSATALLLALNHFHRGPSAKAEWLQDHMKYYYSVLIKSNSSRASQKRTQTSENTTPDMHSL